MSLAHARALVGLDAHVEDFTPERDRRALRSLAMWASRFSPCVGIDSCALTHDAEPDGLIMDISGCDRLFRSEQRHARLLLEGLSGLGFPARIGIGPTIGAAWAMARYGRSDGRISVCPLGASVRLRASPALRAFPVHALRLEPHTIAGLRELGIERFEHVLDLPRPGLVRRFGDEVIHRIDQLLGEAIELIDPVRPLAAACVGRTFDGPTTRLDSVELAVRMLLDDLCDLLLSREAGVRVLDVELDRLGVRTGEVVRETVVLGAPSRDAGHLWSMLRPRLERVQMGFGVEGVRLIARQSGALPHRQIERWRRAPTARADEEAGEQLIDILGNRLGRRNVVRLELVDAHLPERTFRHVESPARVEPCTPHMLERPSILLDRPEPADAVALLPDRPPSWLSWRGMSGRVVGVGPERVGCCWWRSDRVTARQSDERISQTARDYFRVQLESGLWVWVFRANHQWFIHGIWA